MIVLVLGADLFLPHARPLGARLLELGCWAIVGIVGIALTETLVAKMRILRIPVFIGTGFIIALIGIFSWFLAGLQ